MEDSRKQLKLTSVIILFLAVLTAARTIVEVIFGSINNAALPDGATENLLLITKIVLLVLTAFILLPSIYIGVKGIKIANDPKPGKAHIVWAGILLVLACISVVDPIITLISSGINVDNVMGFLSVAIEIYFFNDYIKHASIIRRSIG